LLSGGASVKNGLKFDGEKIDLSLMPPEWIYAFSELFAAGIKKGYPRDNWQEGFDDNRLIAAALRHLMSWRMGHVTDEDGPPHPLVRAAWNLMVLWWQHRDEGHSPALRSGEISEEQRQRNVDGVKALVAGVLGR
jgi:hypothetical protein